MIPVILKGIEAFEGQNLQSGIHRDPRIKTKKGKLVLT
jgi:hypothetical protein